MSRDLPGSHQAAVHDTGAEGFNNRELRNALGSFATGVTIITTRGRDRMAERRRECPHDAPPRPVASGEQRWSPASRVRCGGRGRWFRPYHHR